MRRFPLNTAAAVVIIYAALFAPGCGGDPDLLYDASVNDAADIVEPDALVPDQGQNPYDARSDQGTLDSVDPADQTGVDIAGIDTSTEDNPVPTDVSEDWLDPDVVDPADLVEPDTSVPDVVGPDATNDLGLPFECQPAPAGPVIKVTVYEDLKDSTTKPVNNQSKTDFIQTFNIHDNPWAGIPVSLLAPAEGSGKTCAEGWYYFGPNDGETYTDGPRVLSIGLPECRITTHNFSRSTPIALASGRWKMVVMGDSIAKMGTTPGKFFFDHVAAYLDGFGDIIVNNFAISGSVTTQWLPGTTNFTEKVAPQLADTDVVFITLGGNDIMHYVYDNYRSMTLDALMAGITDKIDEVETNLTLIFSGIKAINPDVEIVWLVYPNYAKSTEWRSMTGTYADMVEMYFEDQMYGIVSWAAGIDGLILVDLFSRMNTDDLNASLWDELHYNQYGHTILGDELFKVLGGVMVTDGVPAAGAERMIGVKCD